MELASVDRIRMISPVSRRCDRDPAEAYQRGSDDQRDQPVSLLA